MGWLLGVAGAIAWLALAPSEERAVRRQLERAAAVVARAPATASDGLGGLVTPDVHVEVDGMTQAASRTALGLNVARYVETHGERLCDLHGLDIDVSTGSAEVTGLLVISDSQAGDLHAEQRPFRARLVKAQQWLIQSLSIGRARKHIPEARP